MDSNGLLRGMIFAWNPSITKFEAYITCGGIILDDISKGFSKKFQVVNCYGPYKNK